LDDVAAVADVPPSEVIEVVEQLRQEDRSFLMPPPPVPLSAETVLDIGHESLIRQWHKLNDWVEEEAASAAMYRRLLQTAHLHADRKAALWSSPDLDEASKWREERSPSKAWAVRYGTAQEFDLAMKFLRDSETRAEQLRQQLIDAENARRAQEQREQTLKHQAKMFKRSLWASAVLGICVIATSAAAWWAVNSRNQAERAQLEAKNKADEAQKALNYAEINAKEAQRQEAIARAFSLEAQRQADIATALRRRAESQTERALWEKGEADKQRAKAEELTKQSHSREIASNAIQQIQTDPARAVDLAIKAVHESSTPQAQGALQQTLLANKLRGRALQGVRPASGVAVLADGNFTVGWHPPPGSKLQIENIADGGTPLMVDIRGPLSATGASPDGKYIAIPDSQTSVQILEMATGKLVAGPLSLDAKLPRVFFSSGGDVFGLTASGGKIGLWETKTGQPLPAIATQVTIPSLSFDGKYLVGRDPDLNLRIWETSSGKEVAHLAGASKASGLSFSPAGKYVVTKYANYLSLWSATSGEWIRDIGDKERPVNRFQFSPDGRQLLTTPGVTPTTFTVWSVEEPAHVITLRHPASESGRPTEAFSPDGSLILTAAGNTIRIWRTPLIPRNLEHPIELKGHAGDVRTARFSRDSRWVISTADDGTAKLWDPVTGDVVANYTGGTIVDAWLTADSRRALTTSRDGIIRIWDAIDSGSVTPLTDFTESGGSSKPVGKYRAAFTPDGKYFLSIAFDEVARIWNSSTGHVKASLGDKNHTATRVFFSPRGKYAITTGEDSIARVWDVETGQAVATLESGKNKLTNAHFGDDAHPWTWLKGGIVQLWRLNDGKASLTSTISSLGEPHCVTVSPDARWLAACRTEVTQKDNKKETVDVVQIIHLPSEKEVALLRGHTGRVNDVFFSEDGKFAVSASYDKNAKVWETGSWRAIATLAGHNANVESAFFDSSNKYIGTVATDNTVRIWLTATGQLVSELRGHSKSIRAFAFSASGRWLVTGSADHTARVWDAVTGKAVAEFHGHTGPILAVAFGPDEKYIMTASADGTIRTHRCELCMPIPELLAMAQQRLKIAGR
jgi:WD40 repeat protein